MSSLGLLTVDDLDVIGSSSFAVEQPLRVAAELVDAAVQGGVGDQADTGYALILAAEITAREGELPAAQVLAERAVEAYRTYSDPDGFARAFHAGLLLRLGRTEEGMAEFTALRPELSEDADAVSYVSEALEAGGRADIAEQWLTAALITMLQHEQELEAGQGEPADEQDRTVAFMLTQQRHRLRRAMNLPHDEYDDLADQLRDAFRGVLDELGRAALDHEGVALLCWPHAEFDRLLLCWPELAEEYGRTWDEYRTTVQRTLMGWSESGQAQVALLAGAVDELAHYADRCGGDPTDPQVRQDYAEQVGEHPREIVWPPGRNESCWCGSGLKYKKCCLPRGRS